MTPRTHYKILPVAGIDDTIEWELHCNAVNNFIKYSVDGLVEEYSSAYSKERHYTEWDSKLEAIRVVLKWAKQLNLIEVCE